MTGNWISPGGVTAVDRQNGADDYAGSRKTADLIRTQLLPQSQALLRSGTAGYGLGRAELTDVLRAEHDLVELLNAEFDEQRQLAAIERLIGGDL